MPTKSVLTQAAWQQYERDGYCATDVLFDSATLVELRETFNRLWQEQIAAAERKGDEQEIRLRRYRPFISGLSSQSEACRRAMLQPALCEIARQIIGEDVDVTYDQAVIKAPRGADTTVENHFNWHQDAFYPIHSKHNAAKWNREKLLDLRNGFMGWIAVTRTTIDNGTLWTVPGMHKGGLLPHDWNEAQREWVAKFDTSRKVPVELEPGQMLIFTPLTPHYSGPNVTYDSVRMAYQFGFATSGTCTLDSVTPLLRGGEPVTAGRRALPGGSLPGGGTGGGIRSLRVIDSPTHSPEEASSRRP